VADLDLNELERLEKSATPGPWEGPWGDTHTVAAFEGELNEHSLTNDPRGDAFPVTQYTQPNDAALIAALRNALPELLRRLRAAEADAERYRWLRDTGWPEAIKEGLMLGAWYEVDDAIDAARGKT